MGAQRRKQRHADWGPESTVGEWISSSEDLNPRQVPGRVRFLALRTSIDTLGRGVLSSRFPGTLRALYTALAPVYDRLVPFVSSAARSLGVSWLDVRDGERVLDVGCGTGQALVHLAAATPEGWSEGLDVAPAMVARTRARLTSLPHDRYRVRRGTVPPLPYPDDHFDAVFSSYVVDVLPRVAMSPVLDEMRRVLRPDGRLVLVVLIPPVGPLETLWNALARCIPLLLGGARPIHPPPLLERAGFSVRRTATRTQLGLRSGILEASPR